MPLRFSVCFSRELKNIYHHHHPGSKKRKSSEGSSGSIHPYGRYGNAGKTSKTISTIAILWPLKAILGKRAAAVEVSTFIFPGLRGIARLRVRFLKTVPMSVPGKRFRRFRFAVPVRFLCHPAILSVLACRWFRRGDTSKRGGKARNQRRKIHPKRSTHNLKSSSEQVFSEQFPLGSWTRVTGEQAKVRT